MNISHASHRRVLLCVFLIAGFTAVLDLRAAHNQNPIANVLTRAGFRSVILQSDSEDECLSLHAKINGFPGRIVVATAAPISVIDRAAACWPCASASQLSAADFGRDKLLLSQQDARTHSIMNPNSISSEPNPVQITSRLRAFLLLRNDRVARQSLLTAFVIAFTTAIAVAQEYVGQDLYVVTSPPDYGEAILHFPGAIALGQCAGTAATSPGGSEIHALVWSPPMGEIIDLQPALFSASGGYATDGHQQVGAVYTDGNAQHAALWSGTADSVVDLHPTLLTDLSATVAYGVSKGQQVGLGAGAPLGNATHALLWNGTPESGVDLNPAGSNSSIAHATDGEYQVGESGGNHPPHAMLWHGTASSAIDLHNDSLPGSFNASIAYGVGGGQQVGYLFRTVPSEWHAVVWNGTADSAVDLNPSDAKTSIAYATNGSIQVGFTTSLPPVFFSHARLWNGTPDSTVDLHDFLPSDLASSTAYSIDAAGNIYGVAYHADGTPHAVKWLTQAAHLANISTRAQVATGDNVLIAGLIVDGTQAKPILIRGIGPSLADRDVPSVLEDPTLELYDSAGTIIQSNDNWKDTQREAIEATGIEPTDDAEAAILALLEPGAYTAILRGANEGVGNGLVEFYDLDTSLDSRLPNISSRSLVQTGDDVLIGGFIVGGAEEGDVIIRALGPSLGQTGVAGALSDPTLELHDAAGDLIASNNDWKETQQDEIEATGIPPTEDEEAALVATLAPGSYTAIVRGAGSTTGVALVEVYKLATAP